MSCIVIHKGKHYSEEEFRKYLFKNKTEFTAALTSSKTITEMFANSLGVDLNQLQLESNKNTEVEEVKGEEVTEEKETNVGEALRKDQSSTAIVEEGKGKESTTKQTSMSPEEIYDSLVKKDNPSHIVISNIRVNDKYNREANLKHAKENGYVYSMEMDNDMHSFSNPWASFVRKGTIKTPDTKTSVLNYIKWLTTDEFKDVKPERRKWILEQIKSGRLKGKSLQYYADLGEPSHADALDYLINVWAPTPSVKAKPNVKIVESPKGYLRDAAKIHPEALYIFTDNTDRTSGDTANVPNNGWYARKYGKGLSFGTLNNPTTAVIRGLDNAYPISTMKRFYKKAGLSIEQSRWTDADFNEFKKVIDDEINTIKEALYSGKYKYIVFPINGVTGGKISQITKERTPKLYAYLNEAIKGLKGSVNNKLDTVPPITRTPAGNIKVEDSPLKGATVATLSYGGAFESLQQLRVEYGLGQHIGLVGSSFGKLSAEVRMDAETAYNDAIEVLGMASKPLSEEAGVSARLQHYLVAKSDKVISIGHTSKSKTVPGETVMLGGPGLAFEYAKRLNEPFYFYQRDRNEWNMWDHAKKAFRIVPAPALSLNTYMVGDINASKEAVYNVFKQVFEASIGKEGKQVKLDGLSPQAAATVEASKKQIESAQGDKSRVVNLMSPKDMVDLTEGSIIQVVMKGTAVPIGTIKDKRLHIEIPEGAENILSEHAIKHLNEANKEEGIVLVDEESIEDLDSLLVNIGGLDATYRAISPSIDNKNPAAHLSTVETVPGKKSTVKEETKTDPAPSTPSGKMSAEEAQELLAEALDRGMTVEELKRERAESAEWVRPKGGPDTSMRTPHNTPFGESYPGSFILPGEEKEVSEETPQENSENLENVPPLSDAELLEESLAYEEGNEATHIDDTSMPGTDDNTVNPVVSEESPSLEEILDIFATPKVKTEPKEEPKPKPAFEEQSSGPVHIEGVDNVSDSDALGSFFDDVANNMPFEQTNEDPYNPINLKEELAWLYSRFGKSLNVKHIDTLIEIAHNRRAFGMFTKDAIILSKLAMEGTAYHEAYHRVSLLYLTPKQRAAIYAEARSKYDLKDASNKVIEERLAEEFRAYKLSKQANIKLSLPKRIAEFFKDLYDMITNFFTGTTRLKKLDIDRLFQAIDKGKFKYTKPNAESLAMLEDSETYFEIGGEDFVKLPNSIDAKNAISFGIRTLLEASGVISTNEAGAPVMNYSIIKDITDIKMENLWRELAKKTTALNNFVIHNGNKAGMKDSVSKALGVIDLFTEILDKKNAFGKAIVEKLRSMDIKSTTEDENFISRGETGEDERKRIVDYDKMSFEVNPKDTVAAKVKLLLSILPANDEITDGNGLPMLSDFDSTWNTLMETVSSSENLTEMMEGLATLALTGKTFSSLYNTLLSDPYAQIGVYTSAFKSKYNFINAIVEETGEGLNIQFASADVQTQAKALLQEWNTAALFNKNLVLSEGESAMNANALRGTKYIDRVNESRIQIVSKMMREDYDEDSKRLANFSSYLKAAEKLFNLMSIGVTAESLEKYVNLHLHPHEALVDLLAVSLAYITGPKSSIYRNIENGTNLNKLMSSEKIIRNLAEATVATSEMDATNSIIGPNGNLYFTIADGTYMNDVLRGLKKLEEVERMLNSTYSSGSIILQAAREKSVRDNLKITTLSSTVSRDFNKGEEYFNLGPAEDTLVRMEAIIKGKFIMPTPADRGFYSFIEGVENIHGYSDVNIEGNNMQVLSTFLKYYKNENDRVKQVRKQINDIVDGVGEMLSSEMFEFYHYKVVNDTSSLPENAVVIGNKLLGYRNEDGVIDMYVGNGANFSDFTGAEIDMSSRDAIRFINNALLAREESTIESLRKDKIITIKNGMIVHSFLNEDLINKLIKEDFSGMTRGEAYDAAVRSIIRHYNVNVIASAIEVNKVFNGDPASFKDIYDETKRLLGLTSTGSRMALGLPESVHNGERLLAIDEYNVMYLNDQLSENTQYDTVYEQYTKSLLEEGLASTEEEAKEIATKRLKALEKFSRTDGQTLVSPEWYRAVSKRLDLWNDEKEEAFNRLISVNKNNANLTKDIDVVMQPLKLLYYQVKRENGNAVTVFDKTSYYPLFKSVYEGTPIEDTINRMESTGRYAGLPKVDVIKFHKSTKSGIQERVDMFEDPSELKARDLTSHPYYVQEFKHLRYQLNTKQHEDNNVPLGVQMNKLGVLNIHNDSTYKIGEDEVSGADIWRHYDRLRGSHTNQGRFRYIENIGADPSGRVVDEATLQAKLKEEAIRANMPGYISNSFGTDELGRKSVEFDAIPGTRRWVENRFFAISRRHTINMESSGNAFIQATDIGLRKASKSGKHTKIREGLKFINEQGLTEVAISISVYKDIIPGYDKMNHKERVSYIMGHDLNLLGYRIPTQGPNSMYMLTVKTFLPHHTGGVIVLPGEGTAIGGFDLSQSRIKIL